MTEFEARGITVREHGNLQAQVTTLCLQNVFVQISKPVLDATCTASCGARC